MPILTFPNLLKGRPDINVFVGAPAGWNEAREARGLSVVYPLEATALIDTGAARTLVAASVRQPAGITRTGRCTCRVWDRKRKSTGSCRGAGCEPDICRWTNCSSGNRAASFGCSLGAAAEDPWIQCAGSLKDDPFFDAWQQEIAEYRSEIDENPDCQ
jgi:hypothetical protein